MQIQDQIVGEGAEAVSGSTVSIQYIGYREGENGEAIIFDQTKDKVLFAFTIDEGTVIPGFDAAVRGMRVGGLRKARIAPEAGYGQREIPNIPANSTLYFLIGLEEVR